MWVKCIYEMKQSKINLIVNQSMFCELRESTVETKV